MRQTNEGGVLASVVINCLNDAQHVRGAIDSVYAQTISDWEIVFWDNASTDQTPEIAGSYDSRLRYFRSDQTLPLYAARKLAMEQCRGAYIGFLDADDLWLPHKLERQVPVFLAGADVGLVHSNARILNEKGQQFLKHRRPQPEGSVFRELLRRYHLCLPTVMIAKQVCEKHGLTFDPSLYYSGDADLFMRIARVSNVRYFDEVTAVYREHMGSRTLHCIHEVPYELEKILRKFGQTDQTFFERYSQEIVEFRLRGQLSVLMAMSRVGRYREQRAIIWAYWKVIGPWAALYLASFFSARGFKWLRRFLKQS